MDTDDLRLRRWGEIGSGYLGPAFHIRFKPGQVLYGSRRTYLRKVAVADFEGICANTTFVLEPKNPGELLPELLPFLMQTDEFNAFSVKNSKGSVNPYINFSDLARFEFVLPPVQEQRRALALLTTGLSTVDELRAATDALLALRRSMETRLLVMDGVPRQKVGHLAKFTSGKAIRVSDLPKHPSKSSPIPVYGGNGISGYTDAYLDGTSKPTVVIGRVGQFCGVTSMTTGPCWITDNALYPSRISTDIHPTFLALCLRAANLNRSKLGEYLPLITQEVVHKIEIPVPPLSEQTAAVEEFQDIETGESMLETRLIHTRSLVMQVVGHMVAGGANDV
nr:restriction endonuclease subunit S [Aromatoleum bremense]